MQGEELDSAKNAFYQTLHHDSSYDPTLHSFDTEIAVKQGA
jgi:hypothetical protein